MEWYIVKLWSLTDFVCFLLKSYPECLFSHSSGKLIGILQKQNWFYLSLILVETWELRLCLIGQIIYFFIIYVHFNSDKIAF